jgi:hypothetical protein
MKVQVEEGSVLIQMSKEVGPGAEVWVTSFNPDCSHTGHLRDGEVAVMPDGNGVAVRMGDWCSWTTFPTTSGLAALPYSPQAEECEEVDTTFIGCQHPAPEMGR